MKTHPAAESFPMMDKKRFAELVEDIKAHGQLQSITICDGMILDGRNRFNACVELRVVPVTKDFTGDPWAYAWSMNGTRRDLVDEQRYLIWKECSEKSDEWNNKKKTITEHANKKRAEAQKGVPKAEAIERARTECSRTSETPERKAKAALSKTNAGAVARGDKLVKERPDLAKAVRLGEMRPAEAHRILKKEEHAEKIRQAVSVPIEKMGPSEIILADPPWRYDHQQAGNREIENHYETATDDEIKKHRPETNDNAILFLWATAPKLREALSVMEAWGFEYVTHAIWDKQKIGMGYWFRGQHELLLVGRKGDPGTPPECCRVSSIFSEARSAHSKKPECVYQWVEKSFPDRVKLEMYCRSPRKGWKSWGNEVNE
jgi:N6-adenosine-specific RNA methylase IME4